MAGEEIEEILKFIACADKTEYCELIEEYRQVINSPFLQLDQNQKKQLCERYNDVLYDLGTIGRNALSQEERNRRKRNAMQGSKLNETEEKIRNLFIHTFGIEPYWITSKKEIKNFRKQGKNITLPWNNGNLYDGYFCFNPIGYSICHPEGLPYFYIGVDQENLFFYLQKAETVDSESILRNEKAVQFLIELEKTFATRTPDILYLSSYPDDCQCNLYGRKPVHPLITYSSIQIGLRAVLVILHHLAVTLQNI